MAVSDSRTLIVLPAGLRSLATIGFCTTTWARTASALLYVMPLWRPGNNNAEQEEDKNHGRPVCKTLEKIEATGRARKQIDFLTRKLDETRRKSRLSVRSSTTKRHSSISAKTEALLHDSQGGSPRRLLETPEPAEVLRMRIDLLVAELGDEFPKPMLVAKVLLAKALDVSLADDGSTRNDINACSRARDLLGRPWGAGIDQDVYRNQKLLRRLQCRNPSQDDARDQQLAPS